MGQRDFTHWQANYSVGDWVLNNQHKDLLDLCRQVIECAPSPDQDTPSQFDSIREELLEAVEMHFLTEENLLRYCGYTGLSAHMADHRESLTMLTDYLRPNSDFAGLNQDLLRDFLRQWWLHHVLESDLKFAGATQRTLPRRNKA